MSEQDVAVAEVAGTRSGRMDQASSFRGDTSAVARENLELVQMLLDRFRAGDHDVFDHYDPEIEWDGTRSGGFVPELAKVFRGHEGVREYWRMWLSAWQPIEVWDYELRDAGDCVVALISGQRMRGRHSGIEVEVPQYALVFTIGDQKVVRWAMYADQREALETVGLLET